MKPAATFTDAVDLVNATEARWSYMRHKQGLPALGEEAMTLGERVTRIQNSLERVDSTADVDMWTLVAVQVMAALQQALVAELVSRP